MLLFKGDILSILKVGSTRLPGKPILAAFCLKGRGFVAIVSCNLWELADHTSKSLFDLAKGVMVGRSALS